MFRATERKNWECLFLSIWIGMIRIYLSGELMQGNTFAFTILEC